MKKYLVRVVPLILVIGLFFPVWTSPSYAAGVNEQCTGDEDVPSGARGCSALDGCVESVCDPGLRCTSDGVCAPKDQSAQLNCACVRDGVAGGNGENAFKCTTDTDPTAIRNSNAPLVFCNTPDKACYTDVNASEPTDPVTINRTDAKHYANDSLRGVTCKPVLAEANCTCLGKGTGGDGADANNFECSMVANQNIKGTATCDSGQKCVTVPAGPDQGISSIAKNQRGELFEKHSVSMRGIKCEFPKKIRPTLPPPPPPPPCKTVVAGVCAEFNTAVGVLGTAPEAFIQRLFAVLLSVSGGIALLLIMKAGYMMMTSQGKPEQLQGGRDQLVAAIVGLVFLIFSFVILQVIGFNLLRIPGFG